MKFSEAVAWMAGVHADDDPRTAEANAVFTAARPMPVPAEIGMIWVVNVTPHAITFQGIYGTLCRVPPSGIVINALPVETPVRPAAPGQSALVETRFGPDPDSARELEALRAAFPDAVIVGSIIAAQAYPERVVAMIPVLGFERVPPAEKRMRANKFTVFMAGAEPDAEQRREQFDAI